jgi:uncharacterized membrane protein
MLILTISLIGISAGLRTFTAPAVVAWAGWLGSIDLGPTPFSFMASPVAAVIFTLLAGGEYIWDLLPNTPSRTQVPALIGRALTGTFSAACLIATTSPNFSSCILGGVAAVFGAIAGHDARVRLVRTLDVKDYFIAIPEDLIAIGLAILSVVMINFI